MLLTLSSGWVIDGRLAIFFFFFDIKEKRKKR